MCKDASGVVVGNKVGLPFREVGREEGERYAEGLGMPYFETSAVTGENVKKVFRTAARLAFKKINPSSRTGLTAIYHFECFNL